MGAFDPQSFDDLANQNPGFANSSPGLAYDAFTAPSPEDAIPALAQGSATSAASDAIRDHATGNNGFSLWGWLGARVHDVASLPGVSTALDYMNKGLQEVQDDYKFVHSVYAKHGFMAGFLVTAGIVGAGAAGAFAGPEASILAAEATASGARRLLGDSVFQDSYADSQNPNYQVSFGRDVANALSHIPGADDLKSTNSGIGKYLSGGLDAVANLSADPLIVAGKIPSLVRGGRYLELAKPAEAGKPTAGIVAAHPLLRWQPIQNFLVAHNVRAMTPEGIDVVRWGTVNPTEATSPTRNGYNRAVEDIAKSDEGTIVRNYPYLRGLAADLGKLNSGDAVHQYLKTSFTATDFYNRIFGPAMLPSRTLLRPLGDKLRSGAWNVKTADDAGHMIPDRAEALDQRGMLANQRNFLIPRRSTPVARDAEGKIVQTGPRQTLYGAFYSNVPFTKSWADAMGGAVARKVRTFTGYGAYAVSSKLNDLSGRSFDLMDPEALEGVRRNLYYAMGDQESKRIVGEMAQMQRVGDVSGLRNLWHSAQVDIVKAAGIQADDDVMAKVLNKMRQTTDLPGGVTYSNDHLGIDHSGVLTDTGTRQLAVDADQTNTRAAFVDYRALRTGIRAMGRFSSVYGKVDDFYSSAFINQFFKPLALMTLGFATRIASAEAIPMAMRYGGVNALRARVAATAAQSGWKLAGNKEIDDVATAAVMGAGTAHAYDELLAQITPDHVRQTVDDAFGRSPVAGAAMKARAVVAPRLAKWAQHLDPQYLDTAIRSVYENGGHIGNEITNAGHLADYDVRGRSAQAADFVAQKLGAPHAAANGDIKNWVEGEKYGRWNNGAEHFNLHWALELQKMSQQLTHQQIAQDVLDYVATRHGFVFRTRGNVEEAYVGDRRVGFLEWNRAENGTPGVYNVHVDPEFRRRGIATELYDRAKARVGGTLAHSEDENLSSDARAWITGMATDEWDHAFRHATHREAARIAGRAYDPSAPDFMGAPLTKADDVRASERPYLERYRIIRPDGAVGQDPLEFASDRVSRLRGATTGMDGSIHDALLHKISDGEKPMLADIENIDQRSSPWFVGGRELVQLPGKNLMNRITQYGFKHVVDPVINSLSRQPLYVAAVTRERRSLQHAVNSGALSEQDAFHIAQVRGTHAILPQIHNTALRTQFSMMANSYLPFYFAQEQAVKRVLHLVHENPAAVRQYQLLYEGITNPAFVNDDGQGNRFLMLPGLGAVGNALIHVAPFLGISVMGGLPLSVQGDMQSLKTVLPEMQMPGVSPFVSFAAQELAKFNPALERSLSALVGDRAMTGDALDWLIPSSPIRSVVRGLRADETDRAFQNAMLTAVASAYYHGQMPSPDASASEQKAAIERIKNNARSVFMIKALYGMASPLAPQVSESDFTATGDSFSTEFQKMIQANKGDIAKALQQFMAEHGSRAVSYTIAKSTPETQGAYMPYTNKAINWIEANNGLVRSKLSTGAAFLVPQADDPTRPNAQAIHDELIALHLRERDTPQQFLNAIYVAQGNNLIAPAVKEHQQLMQQYSDTGDTDSAAAERSRYSAFIQQMGLANPVWLNEYQSSDRTHLAQQAVADLSAIFGNPQRMAPGFETSQVAAVRGLYNEYVNYRQTLLDSKSAGVGNTADIKQAWKTFLDQQESDPILAPVVRSVFMRLANANG